jgi:Fe2+ transport system protein FeoA
MRTDKVPFGTGPPGPVALAGGARGPETPGMRPRRFRPRASATLAGSGGAGPDVPRLLFRCEPGTVATVTSVATEAADALAGVGVLPGTQIAVERVIPLGGPVVVRLGTARVALGRGLAGGVTVEVAGPGDSASAEAGVTGAVAGVAGVVTGAATTRSIG